MDMIGQSRSRQFLALLLFSSSVLIASAAPPDHWVGTWAAAPVSANNPDARFGAADTTYREIVHVSLGGSRVRIIFTNEFGSDSLTIGAAQAALSAGRDSINPSAAVALEFGGNPSVVIPAGALAVSDPIDLTLPAFADLAVSFFVPAQPMQHVSIHNFANQTSYTAVGNFVRAAKLDAPKEIYSWPFLKGVDVFAEAKSAAIVAFGDSITDGAHSTRDANARWPDVLAHRLQANKKTNTISILNEGIGGNRVLHDNAGPSALARFDRDVIAQSGVKYLIILESINDISRAYPPVKPTDLVTAEDLIQGMAQMAERAHAHGIKVYGATLTPYVGATYSSPAGEAVREAINHWIRTTNELDGVIDFDKATQDPVNPTSFSAAAGSPDHLHPGDSGYKLMGDAIDLKLFEK
jgi:lysophospholipase L1-like esterase